MRIPNLIYHVKNNVSLIPPGQRPSGQAAAAGLDSRIILAGLNPLRQRLRGECPVRISIGVDYLTLSLTSSSTTGTNTDSMLFGLTNIE